jgi:integrase
LTAAVIRLLLHNALRVDEACAAGVADLGADAGHRVLRVTREGARKAKVPLTLATAAALDAYLTDRARRAGLGGPAQLTGPLLATATGGGCGKGTCASWCAGWPAPRASTPGRSCRRIPCGTRRSLSPKGAELHQMQHSAAGVRAA